MQLKEMYSGAVNSEETFLENDITATDTIIYVQDGAILPDAPNVLVIGGNIPNAETVKLIEKQDNKLTVERAFQGIAQAWTATTVISRNYTEYDHATFKKNIEELNKNKAETKDDVGLGNVKNYGIATQTEAEAGKCNAKYMTPLRVFQAIAKWITSNIATQEEAETGTDNTKIATPLRVAQAITKRLEGYYTGGEIDAQMETIVKDKVSKNGDVMTGRLDIQGDVGLIIGTMRKDVVLGPFSTIRGEDCKATGSWAHAEGYRTVAGGNHAHVEGNQCEATMANSHAEGYLTSALGVQTHAEGYLTLVLQGNYMPYAGTITSLTTVDMGANIGKFALNQEIVVKPMTTAQSTQTTIVGISGNTITIGKELDISYGSAFVVRFTNYGGASDYAGHAEGNKSLCCGNQGHAEGYNTIVSGGGGSHAEGYQTIASGDRAHAEGNQCEASGTASHAEGSGCKASGNQSHAQGIGTVASALVASSAGYNTIAEAYAMNAFGRYNTNTTQSATTWSATAASIVCGNGSSDTARSNSFRVTNDGKVYGLSAFNSSGADYAEWFEWLDGNPNNEERLGQFVALDGDKIRIATDTDDYIVGVVTTNPSVVGNSDIGQWNGMWLRDGWGRLLYEDVTVERQVETTHHEAELGEEGLVVKPDHDEEIEIQPDGIERRMILNPNYNPAKEFMPREERQEWAAIGMLGQLYVYDDSTCEVNGYCKPDQDGIATKSDRDGYRVIEKKNGLVKIIFR